MSKVTEDLDEITRASRVMRRVGMPMWAQVFEEAEVSITAMLDEPDVGSRPESSHFTNTVAALAALARDVNTTWRHAVNEGDDEPAAEFRGAIARHPVTIEDGSAPSSSAVPVDLDALTNVLPFRSRR